MTVMYCTVQYGTGQVGVVGTVRSVRCGQHSMYYAALMINIEQCTARCRQKEKSTGFLAAMTMTQPKH